MRKKLWSGILIIAILILIALSAKIINQNDSRSERLQCESILNAETTNSGSNMVVTLKNKIHPSLPEYTFKIFGRKKGPFYSANKILITKKNQQFIQKLSFDETQTPDGEKLGVVIEDMNFDGYKDLRIQQLTPAGPNIPYYYWLWDKKSSKFLRNKELEQITSPEFDYKNRVIKSSVRNTASSYSEKSYKYINGVPTLNKEIDKDFDIDKKVWHITIKELKNHKMEIVKKYDEPERQ